MNPIATALHHAEPLLLLAVVLIAGTVFGDIARRMGLPGITGQIVGGVAIGGVGLHLFSKDSLGGLEPLTDIALSLIAVNVGAHLHIGRLANAVLVRETRSRVSGSALRIEEPRACLRTASRRGIRGLQLLHG